MPIGFLPGGGTSVLPRALGLPHDLAVAAAQVAEALGAGRTRRISLGRVNGRRFAFAAGVGLDAEVVRRVDELGRSATGGGRATSRSRGRSSARSRRTEAALEPALEIEGYGRAAVRVRRERQPVHVREGLPLPIVPDAEFELGPRPRRSGRDSPALDPLDGVALLSGHAARGRVPPRARPRPDRDPLRRPAAAPGRRRGSRRRRAGRLRGRAGRRLGAGLVQVAHGSQGTSSTTSSSWKMRCASAASSSEPVCFARARRVSAVS